MHGTACPQLLEYACLRCLKPWGGGGGGGGGGGVDTTSVPRVAYYMDLIDAMVLFWGLIWRYSGFHSRKIVLVGVGGWILILGVYIGGAVLCG